MRSSSTKPRFARLRQLGVIVLITGVTVLLVGELGLRLVGYEDPPIYREDRHLGWVGRRDITFHWRDEGDTLVSFNSAGMRDVEHPLQKPPNTYRIALMGDSYTEALQVDQDKTFWARLPVELDGCPARHGRVVEPLNFGVSSYGTANELLRLEEQGFEYSPDLVLLMFFVGNDIQDNTPELDHLVVKNRPYFVLKDGGLALEPGQQLSGVRSFWHDVLPHSRLAQLLERIRKSRASKKAAAAAGSATEAGLAAEPFKTSLPPIWERSWTVTALLLTRMKREVEAHHAAFLTATIADGIAINPDDETRSKFLAQVGADDTFAFDRRLTAIAAKEDFTNIDLGPPMLAEAKAGSICLHGLPNHPKCRGHWNEAGHAAAARLIAKKICEIWSNTDER